MVNRPSPVCSCCGQSDKTYKISLLYLEASARLNQKETANQPELNGLLDDLYPPLESANLNAQVLPDLIRAFAPPAGEKRVTRRIHPDGLVVGFSLMALLMLYQIAADQSESLPFAVIVMSTALLAYLLLRKPLVQRHVEQTQQEQEEHRRIEQATERWMQLYFCSRDKGVFIPGKDQLVPLEQMSNYLRGSK